MVRRPRGTRALSSNEQRVTVNDQHDSSSRWDDLDPPEACEGSSEHGRISEYSCYAGVGGGDDDDARVLFGVTTDDLRQPHTQTAISFSSSSQELGIVHSASGSLHGAQHDSRSTLTTSPTYLDVPYSPLQDEETLPWEGTPIPATNISPPAHRNDTPAEPEPSFSLEDYLVTFSDDGESSSNDNGSFSSPDGGEVSSNNMISPSPSSASSSRAQPTRHACKSCPTTCGSRDSLKRHEREQHSATKPYRWQCPFKNCKKQGWVYDRRYNAKRHVVRAHPTFPSSKIPDLLESLPE
ncbi:hypothetical protein GMORB2_1891 [Geosmithia morbida]|uniref:C2H2-type domain-containing protein n=1 Tax=Geosmithia morbida TaxID=1094350 RepID=A0A9P4YUY8_9HYPO|nr:uncharacterized protein GMORB2_1891 [Geosmithia morbida]KAF4121484.1 hypothetical protein GMORB2_1891 [Geosmithia morbida]